MCLTHSARGMRSTLQYVLNCRPRQEAKYAHVRSRSLTQRELQVAPTVVYITELQPLVERSSVQDIGPLASSFHKAGGCAPKKDERYQSF